jgi:hypothetical protein
VVISSLYTSNYYGHVYAIKYMLSCILRLQNCRKTIPAIANFMIISYMVVDEYEMTIYGRICRIVSMTMLINFYIIFGLY